MNVLDPYEVCEIEVWPLPEYQNRKKDDTRHFLPQFARGWFRIKLMRFGVIPTAELRGAATLARLAQVISERSVKQGLRRTLLTQAKRLAWLAEERIKPFIPTIEADDKKAKGEKD